MIVLLWISYSILHVLCNMYIIFTILPVSSISFVYLTLPIGYDRSPHMMSPCYRINLRLQYRARDHGESNPVPWESARGTHCGIGHNPSEPSRTPAIWVTTWILKWSQSSAAAARATYQPGNTRFFSFIPISISFNIFFLQFYHHTH